MRFIPDLSVHLVFDLSGLLAVEPLLIHTGLRYVDLLLPGGAQQIGVQFAVWQALGLRAAPDPDSITPFWRIVEPGSRLAHKLACGNELLLALREREGIHAAPSDPAL